MQTTDEGKIDLAIAVLSTNSASDGDVHEAISILATATRTTPAVRERIAEPLILKNINNLIAREPQGSNPFTATALRCVGNACIDNDDARQIVTDAGFSWANACLQSSDAQVRKLTVLVLINVCMDFEPAQKQCFEQNLHFLLIAIVEQTASFGDDDDDRHYPIELLFWITTQKDAAQKNLTEAEKEMPADVLARLLSLPWLHRSNPNQNGNQPGTDDDDFSMILEVIVTFLRDPVIQRQIVHSQSVNSIWQMLLLNETRIAALPTDDEDAKSLLISMSTNLTWCLSDIAANPEFGMSYMTRSDPVPMASNLISSVEETIATVGSESAGNTEVWQNSRTANAACQILGNLLWGLPVKDTTSYVFDKKLHEPLWRLIATDESADLMHSAAGLLIQLTRPSTECQDEVGSVYDAHAALEQLCEHEKPQVKQDGIRLLKSLGKDCAVNQERFASLAKRAMETLSETAANASTSSEDHITDLSR
ncbi:Hypothetical protein R9X50_00573800 [Acrodontium crateriforme]|uniref:ARM repeat-containing protein n=1 Tax=Acrodontium crateriforme TaxID=150365 RepID=A0AAQ3M8K3_9PEZI|nr:Hypothetical protein R9X50_00573800 [Acrodontium crateriforme]